MPNLALAKDSPAHALAIALLKEAGFDNQSYSKAVSVEDHLILSRSTVATVSGGDFIIDRQLYDCVIFECIDEKNYKVVEFPSTPPTSLKSCLEYIQSIVDPQVQYEVNVLSCSTLPVLTLLPPPNDFSNEVEDGTEEHSALVRISQDIANSPPVPPPEIQEKMANSVLLGLKDVVKTLISNVEKVVLLYEKDTIEIFKEDYSSYVKTQNLHAISQVKNIIKSGEYVDPMYNVFYGYVLNSVDIIYKWLKCAHDKYKNYENNLQVTWKNVESFAIKIYGPEVWNAAMNLVQIGLEGLDEGLDEGLLDVRLDDELNQTGLVQGLVEEGTSSQRKPSFKDKIKRIASKLRILSKITKYMKTGGSGSEQFPWAGVTALASVCVSAAALGGVSW
jgi:hypothetical protein